MCCFIRGYSKEVPVEQPRKKIKAEVTTQLTISRCYESSMKESDDNIFKNTSTDIF